MNEPTGHTIEVRELHKRFGNLHAVRGISFAVDKGEVLGFLGPNGAGKSTTMKMITGFLEPSDGTAVVCSHDVREEPIALKRSIGYLPEGAPSYGEMKVRRFLEFIADIRGLEGEHRRRRIGEVVERIHIGNVLDQRIETLSKGFKRRVGLAQAILHDPPVLILDEPTDGLDPNQKHDVRTLINEMAPDKAIIVSTHILEEVDAMCTRAIIIARGQLLFDGTPAELVARSRLHQAVTLTVQAAISEQARRRLGALEGVAATEVVVAGAERHQLRILPQPGAVILEQVSTLVREEGWGLGELRLEQGQLDEVFRTITTGADENRREVA